MCVIIIKKEGLLLPEKTAQKAANINPDGLGIVWLDTYEITYHKSKKWRLLVNTDRPFIAHFRYATVGKVCRENTHPFQCGVKKEEYLMMNGTIKGLGDAEKADSRVLAEMMGEMNKGDWEKELSQYECRFVTVNVRTKKYKMYNKHLWTKHEGIWYSKENVLDIDKYVAVYGTLKKGKGNHYRLYGSTFIGEGTTISKYPLTISGLPYLHDAPGNGHNIEVEVYKVDDWAMRAIDRLEGHPTYYRRRLTYIKLDSGKNVMCWVYFIQSRDWKGQQLYKLYNGVTSSWKSTKNIESKCVFEDTSHKNGCPVCNGELRDQGLGWHFCLTCQEWFSDYQVVYRHSGWKNSYDNEILY